MNGSYSYYSDNLPYKKNKCMSPQEVFAVSAALTALFAKELSANELETLVNILRMLEINLSGIITQIQICKNIPIDENEQVIRREI